VMMIDVFLKMFGIGVGYFVLRIFLRQNFVQTLPLTKIGIAFFIFHGLQISLIENFFTNWLLIYASVFVVLLCKNVYLKKLESRFCIEFPSILTSLILQMKMGQSFRQALRTTTSVATPAMHANLKLIYEHVAFSPQEKRPQLLPIAYFLADVIAEFQKIDQSKHKSVEKIENFRSRLIIVEKFRRRSGRIRGQVHLQVLLMSLIYGIVFAINFVMFNLSQFKTLIIVSLMFYFLGLAVVLIIGRRIRWNV
jgi:hypothetical protein